MNNTIALGLKRKVITWQIDRLFYVIVAMFLLPFAFHLIPVQSDIPLGAVWLPIFYAPLIALRKCKFYVPALSSVFAPTLNRLLTGMPTLEMSKALTLELILFVIISKLFFRSNNRLWFMIPFSCMIAKLVSSVIFNLSFINSLKLSSPGLIVLFIISFTLRKE